MENTAQAITKEEWKEIALHPAVLKMYGGGLISPEELAASVFGAKFMQTVHDTGDELILYTLVDIKVAGDTLLILERTNGVFNDMGR